MAVHQVQTPSRAVICVAEDTIILCQLFRLESVPFSERRTVEPECFVQVVLVFTTIYSFHHEPEGILEFISVRFLDAHHVSRGVEEISVEEETVVFPGSICGWDTE